MADLTIDDFSGGQTDNYIDCPPNRFQAGENLLISRNRKPHVRPGSERDNDDAPLVPSSPTRIGALIPFRGVIFKQRDRDLHYVSSGTMTTLTGPSGNSVFGEASSSSVASFSIWNKHLTVTNDALGASKVQKIYKDNTGTFQVRTAGLPALGSSPAVALTAGASTLSYLYRLLYRYTYTREDSVLFEDLGPTTEVTVATASGTAIAGGAPASITVIPVLTNGSTDNYDTANVTVEVYRTVNNGKTFYFVGRVTNGTTTYSDAVADATLDDQEELYTNGGELDNDPPPVCKYVHSTERKTYYLHIVENGETLVNELRESKYENPDAVPATHRTVINDTGVGVSSAKNIPIVFGLEGIYRIDGEYDDLGRGGTQPIKIADKIGGAGQLSIAQANDLVYFAGTDGFYATDAFRVWKISPELDSTYRKLVLTDTQKKRIYAAYHARERRVLWACNPNNDSDNTHIFVADLNFAGPDGEHPFTTWHGKRYDNEGEEILTDWTASALCYLDGFIYRATASGYTFKHDPELFNDERLVGGTWVKQPIQYDLKGHVWGLGNAKVRKWVSKMSAVCESVSNLSLRVQSDNDNKGDYRNLPQVWVKLKTQWGDSYWGDPILWTNANQLIEFTRYFPSGSLRCLFKQVRFKNAYSNISSSDIRSTCTVTGGGTTKTATIPSPQTFPAECVDYYISFKTGTDDDGNEVYSSDLLITAQSSSNEITFTDSSLAITADTDKKWVMRGYAKGDALKLLSYTIYFENLTESMPPFKGTQGGNNAVTI